MHTPQAKPFTKCLAFDLGQVLFGFDFNIALNKFQPKIAASREAILHDIFNTSFTADFEKGIVKSKEFFQVFKSRYNADFGYEEFKKTWSDIFWPLPDVIKLVERLKAKNYPLYMISNINELHYRHLRGDYPQVFSLFDQLVLSFKVNSIKPERKIYEKLKEVSGREFSEIIYIDDREDLIAAAVKMGIISFQFSGLKKLTDDLNSVGIETS